MIRPSLIMATRSHTSSISSKMWLDMNTVRPFSFSARTRSKNVSRMSGSRPVVGSSSTRISLSPMSAAAMAVFCFMPFDMRLRLADGSSCSSFTTWFRYVRSVTPKNSACDFRKAVPVGRLGKAISPGT